MKILIDLTSLADNFSGIERYAACITKEMLNGDGTEYILIFKNDIHPLFFKFKNHSNIDMKVISGHNKLWFNQIRLPLEIYKIKADWYLFLAFPVPVLLFKKNMVSTIHDICCWDCPETMNGMSNIYFKISHIFAMFKCKRIITISMFSENRIVQRLKYPRSKIWLIYCGIDEKFARYKNNPIEIKNIKEKYKLPDDYILSLSTIEPRKNIRLLIEVYSELVLTKGIDTPLVLAGREGWKTDKLLQDIDKMVKKQILFTGFIDDDDLPTIYGNASLFVFPSMYEGFGMPPLEAMACGTKVLSSDASSLPEVLGEGANYFKSGDKISLRDSMYEMITINDKTYSNYRYFNWHNEGIKLLELLKNSKR